MTIVLMLGSAPMAVEAAAWPRAPFDRVVAINNAWRVRPDWNEAVFPWDFPEDRRPLAGEGQRLITETDFVGATMAFTTGYWALHELKPSVLAVFGCDMHYATTGKTHFYGTGAPDPLRKDITLRSLEAKSARLMVLAAMQGCAVVNLSSGPSRLIFPRVARTAAAHARPLPYCTDLVAAALGAEATLGYMVPSGRYWEEADRFDPAALDRLDALWLKAATQPQRQSA
ncbi:MAG: hypothetical protein NTW20_18385 [Rhodobacterales bacterium]|nr:hypothetical protein [Rhodobacterales bacterium]